MLGAISPLDGRYAKAVQELAPIFSEAALMRYRILVEIEYLIALAAEKQIAEVPEFSQAEISRLRKVYQKFSDADAKKVKQIDKRTNHDVKAVEYFIKAKLKSTPLQDAGTFVHFALTSEDVNNLAYSKMLQDGLKVYSQSVKQAIKQLKTLAQAFKNIPLLALTHGQSASPTTLGKELAVFVWRLKQAVADLDLIELTGKFSGATGNWNAHVAAYPKVNWRKFSQDYIQSLGLKPSLLTTQIEPHDNAAKAYHAVCRINNIVRDLDQDLWLYISRSIFKLKKKKSEVGSSTMPHKVNPIDFENSEGNATLASAILTAMANKLPVSRFQRDLSDSTTLRNQGVALGYSLLAVKNTIKGLGKLDVNRPVCRQELSEHYEVLAEAVQIVLKKHGQGDAYEQIKNKTRGRQLTAESYSQLVKSLTLPDADKRYLSKLTPAKYVGLAAKLVNQI